MENEIMQAAIYGLSAVGSITALSAFWYLKKKSDNETYSSRLNADMESEKQDGELEKQRLETDMCRQELVLQIMKTPEYVEYMERRLEIGQKLIEKNPDVLESFYDQKYFEETLDALVGKNPCE